VGKGGYSSNGKIVSAELLSLMAKLHCHLANQGCQTSLEKKSQTISENKPNWEKANC